MPHSPITEAYPVLGIPVSVTTLTSASDAIHVWAKDDVGRFVCIRDVHGVMQAFDDPRLAALHQTAAMVTPDGMPLVWLGRRAGYGVERTCGPDLMERVLADSAHSGLRHYFYGGKPGVAEALKAEFQRRYPTVNIVGTDTPPFRPLNEVELSEVAQRINALQVDVVWVGLSTPKQEFLMEALHNRTSATFIGVGAAFDFHIGAVKRAPKWVQRSGFEWLYRFVNEPKRLWRRYLILAPRFVWHVVIKGR